MTTEANFPLNAFKQAFAAWIETDEDQDLADLSRAALNRLRVTVANLG